MVTLAMRCASSRSGSVVLAMYGALSCDATLDAITLPLAVTVIVAIAVAVLSYKAVITLAVAGFEGDQEYIIHLLFEDAYAGVVSGVASV